MKKSILFFLAISASMVSSAQKLGTIDSTYAVNGIFSADASASKNNESLTGSALGNNGDVYLCGYTSTNVGIDIIVYHVDESGKLDTNFSNKGIFLSDLSLGGDDLALALTLNSDGKILVTGKTTGGAYGIPFLMQLNADGSLDENFGTGGVEKYNLGVEASATEIVIRADGKIALGGSINNGADFDYYVLLLDSDGSLDNGFGVNGLLKVDNNSNHDVLKVMRTDNSNNIYLGGNTATPADDYIAIAKIDASGTLVASFGTNGWLNYQEGSYNTALYDMNFDVNGFIVGVGNVTGAINNDLLIFRIDTKGKFDLNFDTDGKRIFGLKIGNPGNEYFYSVAVQGDGKIVANGYCYENGTKYALIMRFKADGKSDQGFGGQYGYNLIPMSNWNNAFTISNILIQSNERILHIGRGKINADYDLVIMAIHATEPFPTSTQKIKAEEINVYPNPVNNQFSIETNWEYGNLVLVDMSGRVVAEWQSAQNKYEVPSNLNTGVYFLQLRNENKIYRSKIIIQ